MHKKLLLLLLIFHCANFWAWFNLGIWPGGKDWYIHLTNIHRLSDSLNLGFSLEKLFFIDISYPPLYYWIALIIKTVCFGINRSIFLIAPLFFIVLIVSVYGIAKELKNKDFALLTSIYCSFIPAIYNRINEIDLDIANGAMVSLTIYLLLKTKNFSNTRYSIFFGFLFGCGLLTRSFMWISIIGPLIFIIVESLIQTERNHEKNNILISLIITTFISGYFYLNPASYRSVLERSFYLGAVMNENIFSWQHLGFYIKSIPSQLGLIGTVFYIVGLYQLFKANYIIRNLLLFWILVPFFCFSFTILKFSQYSLAYLPAVAIVITLGIYNIKNHGLRNLFGGILLISMMSLYFYNF